MLCRIWGPNEAENTPGSWPLGQLGGEDNEQFLPLFKSVLQFSISLIWPRIESNTAPLIYAPFPNWSLVSDFLN